MNRSLSLHAFAVRVAAGATFGWATVAPVLAHAQDLAPPPPMDPSQMHQQQPMQPQTMTTRELTTAEREDSGRGLEFFYVDGGPALSYVGLSTFNSDKLSLAKASSVGPELDLGLGARLLVFSFGPRLRWHAMNGFDLWQVNGEAAFHLPLGALDLSFGLHAGYSFLGNVTDSAVSNVSRAVSSKDVKVRGFDVGLHADLDYYLSSAFSIGGDASAELLVLSRPAVSGATDPSYAQSGSSLGLGALLGAHAGLHL